MSGLTRKSKPVIWRSYRRVPVNKLPYARRQWVLDRGSLTKRLIHASSGDFKVNISRHIWAIPSIDEQHLLALPLGQKALIREVSLLCKGEVWVKARSVIPIHTLTGTEKQLAILGDRPLGAYLFKSRTMKRGPLQIASFQDDCGQAISARRSIFYMHKKSILVSEFFMPIVFQNSIKK